MDIVSGSSIPDLRFLLKSQFEHHVNENLTKIINEIQSEPLEKRDEMWFRQSDFAEKQFNCTTVRQTLHKERYV